MSGIRGGCPRDECSGTVTFDQEHPHLTGTLGTCDRCGAVFQLSHGETKVVGEPKS